MHYGDITMTFLNNWFAADARGTSLTYASVVAVEEKSVIDYNQGNPDGVLSPGEEPRVPRDPLVAIYPEEGTLFSDSPFIVLDTEWVDDDEKAAAAAVRGRSCSCRRTSSTVLEFGFRPNNPTVPLADPIVAANGVDPTQPTAELEVPAPDVLVGILDSWAELRKDARVLLVLDISGSMGELAADDGKTRLDLAKEAAVSALDQFKDTDDVGLWVFSTDLGGPDPNVRELVPVGPIGEQRDVDRRRASTDQFPTNGTPLYDVTEKAYETMVDSYDPAKINAIVLLTDGENDDGDPGRRRPAVRRPHRHAAVGQRGVELAAGAAVHDLLRRRRPTCRRCGRSPRRRSAATYNASNPATINQVFTAVISNF